MKGKNMIQIDNLSKSFRKQTVLHNINIAFEKGKIHGIIGKNGSGKTVLLKCICGLIYPDAGTVTVAEKRIGKDVDFAPNTGIIIETPFFLPYKSGINTLYDLSQIKKVVGKPEIVWAMNQVGLDPENRKPVGKYSLGMRQRLGIAQAIMESPELLILDEPMNGLDKQSAEDMRQLLITLRKEGKTILLASHNSQDIELVCDTVCEMDLGQLTQVSGF